ADEDRGGRGAVDDLPAVLVLAVPDRRRQQRPDPDPDHRDPAPAVAAGHQPLERPGRRAEPAAAAVHQAVRAGLLRAERVHPVLGDAGDGLPGGPGPGDLGVGAVADRTQETRHVPGVLVGGGVGGGAAVLDEYRGLVPDRERPAAVDRAGHHADQERDLADAQHHLAVDQPDRLRPALRHARHRRPAADAAVLPRTAPAPAHRRRRGRAGTGRPVLEGVTMSLIPFWYVVITILW